MTKARKIIYGSILGVVAALFVLGAFFDLTVANAVYQPENVIAKIFETAGIFPPFVFVGSTFATLFFLIKEEDKKRTGKRVLFTCLTALSYIAYGFMASETLFDHSWQRVLVGVGAAAVLTPLTLLFFRGRSEENLKRFEIFLIFASIVSVVSSLISINVLKYIWGRPRYREMVADGDLFFEAFTPWYHINGFTLHGHHSFPSGHTCSATNLLVLCALGEVFPDAEKRKGTIAFVVGMYIFAMAYSRMVLGAHFLSDVTGGFFIGFITYAVARFVYFDKSRAVVSQIMGLSAEERSEEEAAREITDNEANAERVEIELPVAEMPAAEETDKTDLAE